MKAHAVLTLLLLSACTAAAKEPSMAKIGELISDFSQYTIPQGWTTETGLTQGDSRTVLSRDLHAITIRLAGGQGSRYKTAGDFLVGFEARSSGGKPAEKLESAVTGGARVIIYRRKVPVRLPPPDASGPAEFTTEEFCVVPAGKRFFVLKYSYGDSVPDPRYNGKKAWRDFLKTFKLKKQ